MDRSILLACLVIVGLLGLAGALGGIYLVSVGASAAEAMAIFGLGQTVAGGILGVFVGRSLPRGDD